MRRQTRWLASAMCLAVMASLVFASQLHAEDEKTESKFTKATKDLKTVDGMFTLYHDEQKLLVLIKNADLKKNYFVATSIARGISSGSLLGGYSWGFGDDAIWTFKKVGDKLHVVRRNVRFKAKAGTPEADAVKLAYSDSVLYSLPIIAEEKGGLLVDMTRIFMSDDQQIGSSHGLRFASDRSTWAKLKAFPENVELQVAAVYTGSRNMETVADPRGVQINVHYSISELPSNGYHTRLADDRVGYFLTAVKDFSENDDEEHFVRYINRWKLEKAAPDAELSPPKEPIVFYIEKTVPIELRPYVKAGILEWNKAFRKLGFDGAIEVRQQREDDDWDPEDVRYNTFRWITAEAGFAMGPSRVNPMTGQILDADIIFDASFLRYWTEDWEVFTPEQVARLTNGVLPTQHNPSGIPAQDGRNSVPQILPESKRAELAMRDCSLGHGMQQQMGFAATALIAMEKADANGKLPDEFIHQALKEVVMHEVGHTLGLRHNFKASSWKSLKEINNLAVDSDQPTVASVMDYTPANIAPKGSKQGPYYTPTIGPYDEWAIEYGYKVDANEDELAKIASRGAEDGLDYLTDEDTRSYDSDPLTNRFDLGENPIEYARTRMDHSTKLLEKILERVGKDGEGYQKVRQAFGMLFSEYWRTALFAARFPGGLYVHRDHKGDKDARPPFKVVEAAKQREAMKLITDTAFGTPQYDPELLNHLAASRWNHWGMGFSSRIDYPIHDYVEMMQSRILGELLSSMTLSRLHDGELKVAADTEAYTLAEHLRTLADGIFAEWKTPTAGDYTDRKPYVSSFRRGLQRMALKDFGALVTRGYGYPEDARTLARMHLNDLDRKLGELLSNDKVKLDDYSRAHLLDCQQRIQQVLKAELQVNSIN